MTDIYFNNSTNFKSFRKEDINRKAMKDRVFTNQKRIAAHLGRHPLFYLVMPPSGSIFFP